MTAATAGAAPPAPASGSASVDGSPSEWSATRDFFSDMIRAGGNGGQTKVESKLFLRYDCATHVAYALVLAQPGISILTNQPDDNFVKIGGVKKVDASFGDDGTAPDFAYVGASSGQAAGWEASFPLAPGSYTLNVHAQVEDGGSQTSAVPDRAIPLEVECGEVPQPLPPPSVPPPPLAPPVPPSIVPRPTPPVVISGGATPPASLRVTKRGPQIAMAGAVVPFTIVVRNTSTSSTAASVTLSDVLPVGYSLFRRPAGTTFQKGRLVWSVGTLAPGATKTVRVQIRLDRAAAGTRCNTAVASAANAPTVRARACTKVLRVTAAAQLPIVTG